MSMSRKWVLKRARRAFNEDERWKSGPTYVFVDEMTPVPGASRAFVFPPDPSREGVPWGELVDIFGSDLILEFVRLMSSFGEGWTYYDFTNPASEKSEPKAAYAKAIDWNGVPAAIGAGIYQRDIPGTCNKDDVNATVLAADPSNARLKEFVRCAAMELESQGTSPPGRYRAIRAGGAARSTVRPGYLRLPAVQRRSLQQPVVGQPCSRVERLSGRSLRRPGCGERRRCVRGNLPVLLDAQSRHWNAAAQGDVR